MQRLKVYAGRRAQQLLQQGFDPNLFETMIGASGGPKWFSLYGLDHYFISEFFQQRQKPLQLLGSSAGAWRFACYAQQDGVGAITRFCQEYRQLVYPKKANRREVTEVSKQVLSAIFPDDASRDSVFTHPVMRLNFIIARYRRLTQQSSHARQVAELSLAAAANLIHRRHIGRYFERVICQHPSLEFPKAPTDLPTESLVLSPRNIEQALFASGSIPIVLDPVRDITDAPTGLYIDGGLTDYHFSWPFTSKGLVLFPHFSEHVIPGWFDKKLKRTPTASQFDNVVLVCPSAAWRASLPGGKIPDRTDFTALTDAQRIARWQTVTERSFELADDLRAGHFQIEPLPFG